MKTVHISTANSNYNVIIEKNSINKCGEYIRQTSSAQSTIIATDNNVAALYLDKVVESLKISGFTVYPYVFPAGESSKNIDTFKDLLEFAIDNNIKRNDIFISLGGGVVGDICGFAASVYMRGCSYVHIPTTIISQTDSSIGGKTGINLNSYKNIIGAFHSPKLVITDTNLLNTLPQKEFSSGMAEVIKYACIKSSELFTLLEKDDLDFDSIISKCVEIKHNIVSIDEFDYGERMILNFGHTIGHAIEKITNYEITHGEAVAIGMNIITKASENHGLTETGTFKKLYSLCKKYNLPCDFDIDINTLINTINNDKKSTQNFINTIFIEKIGKAFIKKLTFNELKEML